MQSSESHSTTLSMPGRLCLFGEHSDWAGAYRTQNPALEHGYCLITATDQTITAHIARHPDSLIVEAMVSDSGQKQHCKLDMNLDSLRQHATAGEFFAYCAGAAHEIKRRYDVGGLALDAFAMDLPMKKGLSSSAAICMLTARAFNILYDLRLSIEQEIDIAYQGETLTGSQCGRMDQACAYGQPVFLTFDGDRMAIETVVAGACLYLVIVDLRAEKNTRVILADLNRNFPFTPGPLAAKVRQALGSINKDIVMQAKAALVAGDAPQLGTLMTEAQRVFDELVAPASPEELAAPRLQRVLAFPPVQELIYGGKGVGSQGDGSAQLLCRSEEARNRVMMLLTSQLAVKCLPLTIRPEQNTSAHLRTAAGA